MRDEKLEKNLFPFHAKCGISYPFSSPRGHSRQRRQKTENRLINDSTILFTIKSTKLYQYEKYLKIHDDF